MPAFFFILGTFIGSFLNVCLYRMPKGQSIIFPGSRCPSCGSKLVPLDLIPLFSYFLLWGKCRYCGTGIPAQYPLVELTAGLLFAFSYFYYGLSVKALGVAFLFSLLVVISIIDIQHHVIPNRMVLMGFINGVIINFYAQVSFLNCLYGLAAGGGLLFIIALVTRGGMGGGDIKLAAMLGYYLGWEKTLVMLFSSFLFGACAGIYLVLTSQKNLRSAIAFGPFLALGGTLAYLWGADIIKLYCSLFVTY